MRSNAITSSIIACLSYDQGLLRSKVRKKRKIMKGSSNTPFFASTGIALRAREEEERRGARGEGGGVCLYQEVFWFFDEVTVEQRR